MRDSNDYVEHLSDIGDGIGCTEIWEHLSDRRMEADAEANEDTDAAGKGAER
ncbi:MULTISPECIES: hypothetical protein [unclassified Haladaptatus]|uniref:hypothetical protein n=1 Tax=unclassified Haladaptatus TaxID=2622732 RepID=UPI00209BF45C|nr:MULTISPECIES: hypothetical protein [unclassified Haladaptatus]MCO8246688.1 hypothetical protein [Haladaptatus sp. AB643]MCO8256336.1 hypothetical protein [Haladaptatus sp. AB618]